MESNFTCFSLVFRKKSHKCDRRLPDYNMEYNHNAPLEIYLNLIRHCITTIKDAEPFDHL